jgi:hypothetical protein
MGSSFLDIEPPTNAKRQAVCQSSGKIPKAKVRIPHQLSKSLPNNHNLIVVDIKLRALKNFQSSMMPPFLLVDSSKLSI